MNKRWKWITGLFVLAAAGIVIGFLWRPWISSADALTKEAAEHAVLQLYPGEIIGTELSKGVYTMQLSTEKGRYEMQVDALSGEILTLKRLEAFTGEAQPLPVLAEPQTPAQESASTEPSNEPSNEPASGPSINPVSKQDKPKNELPKPYSSNEPEPSHARPSKEPAKNTTKVQTPKDKPSGNVSTKADSQKEPAPAFLTAADAAAFAVKQVQGQVKDTDLRESASGSYYLVEIRNGKEKKAIVQVNAITGAIMSVTWDDHGSGDDGKGKGRKSDDSGKHGGHNDDE